MTYFVISDTKFNDAATAKQLKMSLQDYNEMLISKWNSAVSDDDSVFIFGQVAGGLLGKEIRPIIERLNGRVYIVNYFDNKYFNRDRWKSLGIHAIWDCNFTYPIDDDTIFFPAAKISIEKIDRKEYKYICLREKDGAAEVYKDRCLSIEAKYWDYTPIRLREIPEIIKRMSVFEEMEEN